MGCGSNCGNSGRIRREGGGAGSSSHVTVPATSPKQAALGLLFQALCGMEGLRIQGAPGLLDMNEKIHSPSPPLLVWKQSPK